MSSHLRHLQMFNYIFIFIVTQLGVCYATLRTKPNVLWNIFTILASSLCKLQPNIYISIGKIYIYYTKCTYGTMSLCLEIGVLLCSTPPCLCLQSIGLDYRKIPIYIAKILLDFEAPDVGDISDTANAANAMARFY